MKSFAVKNTNLLNPSLWEEYINQLNIIQKHNFTKGLDSDLIWEGIDKETYYGITPEGKVLVTKDAVSFDNIISIEDALIYLIYGAPFKEEFNESNISPIEELIKLLNLKVCEQKSIG